MPNPLNPRAAAQLPAIPRATGPVPSLQVYGAPCWPDFEDGDMDAVVESWGENGAEATMRLKCYWQDRYRVVQGLRGGVVRSGLSWTYHPWASYPYSPNLKCTAINSIRGLKPYIDTSGLVQYEFARIEAFFSVPGFGGPTDPVEDASGIPMTRTKFRGSASTFAPPIGSFVYLSGDYAGKPVGGTGVDIIMSQVEISMTRMMIPFPAVEGPTWIQGCVNDEPVTFGDYEFPRGCLLAGAFDEDPNPDPSTGALAWDITFSIIGRFDVEWNEVIDPKGNWSLVNTNASGTGEYPFPYEDFSILFSNDLRIPPGEDDYVEDENH